MNEAERYPEYTRLLQQSFLLSGAPPGVAERLLESGCRLLPFSKGQTIFGHGLNQDCLGLLVSGRATAFSGEAVILRGFTKGDIFGAAALFAAAAEPFSLIQGESEGSALLLPRQAVQQLIVSEPTLAENYIRFLAQRIAFLNRKIATLSGGEAVKRLATHIAAASKPDPVGRAVFSGNISRLAQSIGVSRASLYRALAQLTEQGLLHREGKIIVIDDLQGLNAYK